MSACRIEKAILKNTKNKTTFNAFIGSSIIPCLFIRSFEAFSEKFSRNLPVQFEVNAYFSSVWKETVWSILFAFSLVTELMCTQNQSAIDRNLEIGLYRLVYI